MLKWYGTPVRWLVFTNLYVALCGASLTSASYALLDTAPRIDAVVGVVFCCTLVIYNLDRLIEPNPGDSLHEQWVERHRKPLWALTALAGVGTAVLAVLLQTPALISLLVAGVVAVGYCVPVMPGRQRWMRLKELPGAKLLLIAGVWTYATAGLPMIEAQVGFGAQAAAVLSARLLFIAAVALPFDVPDMKRDQQSGIATLPTLIGVRSTRRAAIVLALASACVGAFNPLPFGAAVILSALLTAALLLALRADRGPGYFMVALDGMLLVQAAGLLALA